MLKGCLFCSTVRQHSNRRADSSPGLGIFPSSLLENETRKHFKVFGSVGGTKTTTKMKNIKINDAEPWSALELTASGTGEITLRHSKGLSQPFRDVGRKRKTRSRHRSAQQRITWGRGEEESGFDEQVMRDCCRYWSGD